MIDPEPRDVLDEDGELAESGVSGELGEPGELGLLGPPEECAEPDGELCAVGVAFTDPESLHPATVTAIAMAPTTATVAPRTERATSRPYMHLRPK
ncbi:hypothetical protein [Catenulispora yoronensis]|uniref:hypothetical protein n=1 Tax=Catenulispora yoronensis TaxID=450799 RepID=UPI0031E2E37D